MTQTAGEKRFSAGGIGVPELDVRMLRRLCVELLLHGAVALGKGPDDRLAVPQQQPSDEQCDCTCENTADARRVLGAVLFPSGAEKGSAELSHFGFGEVPRGGGFAISLREIK